MINKIIEELLYYANTHLELDELDTYYVRNLLLTKFNQIEPYDGKIDKEKIDSMDVPDEIIEELVPYFLNLTSHELDALISEIMALISPRPSKIRDRFFEEYKISPQNATEYLYQISKNNFYFQKTKVDKNKVWISKDGIEISINLSKPEKNNKDIAKLLDNISTSYPKCMLCVENLGFIGNAKKPSRVNHRLVPLSLNGETWYLQYSPYGYFNRHIILINKEHSKMIIDEHNIAKLFEFIDMFPHFIVGSNSDLPITGGSILDHEHFQGGEHIFPMMKKDIRTPIKYEEYIDLEVGILDWYNSTILIKGKDKKRIISLALKIYSNWLKYDNLDLDILSYECDVRHNSITPILRKIKDEYYFYVMLRNNRVNKEYPDGIFHARKEYHHIKKEGIGLIEAMGLYVLPARLDRQLPLIEDILSKNIKKEQYLSEHEDLFDFVDMIEKLKSKSGEPHKILIDEVENVCKNILENTAVFKNDEKGQEAFVSFLTNLKL